VEDTQSFEEAFLCCNIKVFLDPFKQNTTENAEEEVAFPLQSYPKNQKFTRIVIMRLLQVNPHTVNRDEVILISVNMLKTMSECFKWQKPIPFD